MISYIIALIALGLSIFNLLVLMSIISKTNKIKQVAKAIISSL